MNEQNKFYCPVCNIPLKAIKEEWEDSGGHKKEYIERQCLNCKNFYSLKQLGVDDEEDYS